MRAVVFHDIGDIRLDEVDDPQVVDAKDAVVGLTASAICGTDLHLIRGTMSGMKSGTIIGHEGVGIVESVGFGIRNFRPGDRVVVASTIACGYCEYCRAGLYAQCDNANPNGKAAGTAFFGGPQTTGSFNGLQAEKVRVPFANIGLVKVPSCVTDDQAILVSDILPTGYFGADLADIRKGNTVTVFGCGPVGLCAILSARFLGAGRIFAVDTQRDRLEKARELGAEAIDFQAENPVEVIMELTDGHGSDRVIDAVGIDAEPESPKTAQKDVVKEVAPKQDPQGDLWQPGQAPIQVLQWSVACVAKAGTIALIGVYSPTVERFPIGAAMNKNLTLRMGNCNHRKYIPHLLDLIASGLLDPSPILTKRRPFSSVLEAYKDFDLREPGWIKVKLEMQGV